MSASTEWSLPAEVPSVELVVPRLVPALSDPAAASPALPCLQRWLSRARLERSSCDSLEQALCERFGVARQTDWPIAPLTLLADGMDPGDAFWLRADPAHLHAVRGELVLAGCGDLDQTQADADTLVATLNQHFAAESLHFIAARPERWYLRAAQPQALLTVAPSEAAGRSVDPLLPRGEQALGWHRRLNEMQMLLHDHPVNAAREARGELPLNSVWLWGGGSRAACTGSVTAAVWSDAPLARGLALCAGATCHALPPGADRWLQGAQPGQHLIVLDDRPAEPRSAVSSTWAEGFERDWVAPLLAAIRAGTVERATLITHHGRSLLQLTATRLALWKFWRRVPDMGGLAGASTGA
jgi:hypothetical protein